MNIYTDAWHLKIWFYWSRFSPTYREGYRENLCHYVRVLLFWAPGLWVRRMMRLQGKSVGVWLNLALFVVSITFLFVFAGWLFVAILIGSVLTAILLVTLAAMGVGLYGDRKPLEIPGTVKLVAAYVMARKRRVCPFITFVERSGR